MSMNPINHSADLLRLRGEQFDIQIKGGYLFIRHIPYVNADKQIKYGTLISELTLQDKQHTLAPGSHTMYFQGEQPCYPDGTEIIPIKHGQPPTLLFEGCTADKMFSFHVPAGDPNYFGTCGYKDYYHKVTNYVAMISAPATALDPLVTARTGYVEYEAEEESVFNYPDTNSSRANINPVADKLKNQRIAIIGLGGTGSYILDLVAKTSAAEIHLFDADVFSLHNAFRAPGAPTNEQLQEAHAKVDYLYNIYSRMHKHIIVHKEYLTSENLTDLAGMSFVFISIDKGAVKKYLTAYLIEQKIPFADVGMGVSQYGDMLTGTLRSTLVTASKNDHVERAISFETGEEQEDIYKSNIQIAELNMLNAVMAVLQWKKLLTFYHDAIHSYDTTFTINDALLYNGEIET